MQKETKYNSDQYYFNYPDGIENHYWNVARNNIILDTVKKYNLNKIIDVGCGRAIVTSFLYTHKIDIMGVELGLTTPISNSKVPILYNIDAVSIPAEQSKQFNTISLFDVIEHIEDPVSFIRQLVLHFPNVDKILLTVPARAELWTNYDDFYGHYRRYSLKGVNDTMKECGFQILENKYFFHTLYYLIWCSKLFKKREISANPPQFGIRRVIHKWLGNIFLLEKFFFPKRFVGSSIICIAVKK